MKERIKTIINLKAHGKQKAFAEMMGWTSQYTHNLIAGSGIGLQPIMAILQRFPDIDARWLLTGEGMPISISGRANMVTKLLDILDYDRYVKYMNEDEQLYYCSCLQSGEVPQFPEERVAVWKFAADTNEQMTRNFFEKSKICRTKEAK